MKLMIALALFALSPTAHSASLRLDGGEYVGIIQVPALSCVQQVTNGKQAPADIPGAKALFGTLRLSWSGPSELKLESMIITFPGKQFPGGKQVAQVSGAELGYLWGSYEDPAIFGARESRSSTPFCFFQVGNLSVVNPYEYFEGVGTIRAVGSYQEGGVLKSVSTELPFRFHYNPVPRK
jgi:hypothetical protein